MAENDAWRPLIDFWYTKEAQATWWEKDRTFDDRVRGFFGADHARAAAGNLDGWRRSPAGSLALVLLLDQVPRNIHRETPAAFATDSLARAVADHALSTGQAIELPHEQRFFLFMPFEHSETLADQDRSTALFETYQDEHLLKYAHRHREIILRFGRFPHRNAILGRISTPEEKAFLTEPDSSF